MNRYDALKRKLGARERVIGTTMQVLNSANIVLRIDREDLDFLLFDLEHGQYNVEGLVPMLSICRLLGLPSLVRVQDCSYHLIAKSIDMGADGVMLPRVERLEQIRTAIDGVYFAPIGKKGCGGLSQFRHGESFDQFQQGRFIFPQIESLRGVEMLPEMLDEYSEYISGVIVGPYDMSIQLGTPLDIASPAMRDAIARIVQICMARGKSVGVFSGNSSEAVEYWRIGANILWTGIDIQFFTDGYNNTIDALATLTS